LNKTAAFCGLRGEEPQPPVANAMNEKRHGRSMHRSAIQDQPLAPLYLMLLLDFLRGWNS
jgi:hypothetical protein